MFDPDVPDISDEEFEDVWEPADDADSEPAPSDGVWWYDDGELVHATFGAGGRNQHGMAVEDDDGWFQPIPPYVYDSELHQLGITEERAIAALLELIDSRTSPSS